MRKLLALLLILSLVIFSVTACFGGDSDDKGNEGEGGSENGGEGDDKLPYDPANPGDQPYIDSDGWT
jgi:hypothetical protein